MYVVFLVFVQVFEVIVNSRREKPNITPNGYIKRHIASVFTSSGLETVTAETPTSTRSPQGTPPGVNKTKNNHSSINIVRVQHS